MRVWYLTRKDCEDNVFPRIHEHLTDNEPAPMYRTEKKGMVELEKILSLVRVRHFYRTFFEKSAYLICSIVTAHAFSNGNKRLAVSVLLRFLLLNNFRWKKLRCSTYRKFFRETFPGHHWKNEPREADLHFVFLYNLAVALANRPAWGGKSYADVRDNVVRFFEQLYIVD